MPAPEIRIGGLTRMSLCDWPGQIVATLFTQGCPWDCHYCHNPELIPADVPGSTSWAEVRAFLHSRRGLLDGVVFSGGEPILHRGLPDAMREIRDMGFAVGLHTGGAYPRRLALALPLVDWIGFDVKSAFADYAGITAVPGSGDKARESLRLVLASGIPCDIRTTASERWLDQDALARLTADLAALGTETRLQEFRTEGCRMDRLPDPGMAPGG